MGMENQYVSADSIAEQFTEIEISKRTENDDEEELEAKSRIGGILHPNEKLPRPEPPPGVTQNDVVVTELKLPAGMKVIVKEKKGNASVNDALKGRVTFFSRSNCRDCGAVRSFLREKGLSYVEINLDVYPMREKELSSRTHGSMTVPKIFFNAKLIGGLAELNEMRRTKDLSKKLNELLAEKCPAGEDDSAPLPPVYGLDDVAEDDVVDEMTGIVHVLKQRLGIQDRLVKMRIVSDCFLAQELVAVLCKYIDCDHFQAVEIGKDLLKKHFIHPVFGEHEFEDGNHVYRLLEHEPYIPKCYNFRGSTYELEPKNASEIGRRLGKIMCAVLESYASQDRQFVDYMAISNSEEFRRYLNLVQGLQRVDITSLSPNEKLAFFLNLYNAMVIHGVIRLGHPQGMMDRKSMANDFQYLVGGQPYSLNTIKNGILRANRRPPYFFSKPFASGDKCLEVALPTLNPLIHFGLCDGTRSAPTVRFFTPENVEAELKVATRDFFSNDTIEVDLSKRTVYLSSIIKWFSADFGSEKEILKWIINYLGSSNAGLVTHLLGDYSAVNMMYQSYDWSLNS